MNYIIVSLFFLFFALLGTVSFSISGGWYRLISALACYVCAGVVYNTYHKKRILGKLPEQINETKPTLFLGK